MPELTQEISRLEDERRRLIKKKDGLVNKLKAVESDLQSRDFSDAKIEQINSYKKQLDSRVEKLGRGINAIEEDIRRFEGGEENRRDLADTVRRAESVLTELDTRFDKIEEEQESARETIRKIEKTEEQIAELEESARALIERSTSAALGDQFAGRKSELEKNLKYWRYGSIGSILLLILSAGVIYYDIITTTGTAVANLSKIALVLPISVTVWFSVSNYSRQKKLMEEYEFKARMALSLSGFREVLREETGEDSGEQTAEFVVETMDKIYSNPQENIQTENQDGQQDPLTTGQRPLVELIRRMGN